MLIKTILCTFILAFTSLSVNAMEIRHVALREGSDLDQYALDLLKFMIKVTGNEATFVSFGEYNAQTRRELLLQEGEYDIDWLGATAEIEERVEPVRYPILRGLLGHRVFITNQETYGTLSKDMSSSELKQYSLVQGQGWGDIAILTGGGFTRMQTNPIFDNLFKMVENQRADLFPRSIIEPYSELNSRCKLDAVYRCTDRNLLVDDKLLVVYKFPMFYFVSPKNPELSKIIETAFQDHYDEYLDFFNSHPLVKGSLKKLEGRTVFKIEENKSLSPKTEAVPDKYWLSM